MVSKKIVDSDAFMDMALSTQALYFHLLARADDDGFVGNPKKIMRMIGAGEDEFKVLIAKRFILLFPSGVCVIKHWLIHNYIRGDRYNETQYLEEKSQLETKENKAYTECHTNGIPNDIPYDIPLGDQGKVRLGKVRKDKYIAETKSQQGETNDEEIQSSTPEFNSDDWIKLNVENTRPHIRLIGYYFLHYTEHNFPTKEVAEAELKKNVASATWLLKNFKKEDIVKTMKYCKEKYAEIHWNLVTVKKQISYVTAKKG